MLASAHWNNTYPKFNTPKKRVELTKFAEEIEKECAVPVLGFNKDGIAKHIQDFFNEQRRYKRRKLVCNSIFVLVNVLNSSYFLFLKRYISTV